METEIVLADTAEILRALTTAEARRDCEWTEALEDARLEAEALECSDCLQ